MSLPNSLYITGIDTRYNANMIANILYQQGIGTVSRITLLPEDKMITQSMKPHNIYVKAYVEMFLWHDTERANMIINCIMNSVVVSLIDQNNVWEVKLNKRPNICYHEKNQDYTTIFQSFVTDVFVPTPSIPTYYTTQMPMYMPVCNSTPMMYPMMYPNCMLAPNMDMYSYPVVPPNYTLYA